MLISYSELLGRSWRYTTREYRHLLPFVLWMILPNMLMVGFGYLALLADVTLGSPIINFIAIIALGVLLILNLLLSAWITLSLTYSVGRGVASGVTPHWKESFHATVPLYWSCVWVSALSTLIISAGTILFLVPGIIFTGWYLFSSYEVIFSHGRGLGALAASKAMVVGRWWSVVLRFVVITLVYVSLSVAIQALVNFLVPMQPTFFDQQLLGNLIRSVVTSVVAPFLVTGVVMLYMNVKQTPNEAKILNPKL